LLVHDCTRIDAGGACSLLGAIGGGFGWGRGTYINRIPIWDVFAGAGGRGGVGERLRTCSRSRAFQIRQAVPVGLGFSFWAHLWAVLVGVKMYLGLITLIETYSTFYMAIGGREGVDAVGQLWMTWSINRTSHQLGACGIVVAVGDIGHHFS
jgi:hypothetical protein